MGAPAKKNRRSYVAQDLPTELYDALADQLQSLGLIRKGRSRWTKRFLAGFLRAVQVGFINRSMLELFWEEGEAAAVGGRKRSDAEYRQALAKAARESAKGRRGR